jgi:HSP20 family protein
MQKTMGPTLEIARIQSEINRLFESLKELKEMGDGGEPVFVPNTDVLDGRGVLTLYVELPGVALHDLILEADGGNIIVRGVKKKRESERGVSEHHCLERTFGSFERVIALNYPINTHKAEAVLSAGVLKVVFPKVENRRGGAVPIPVKEA